MKNIRSLLSYFVVFILFLRKGHLTRLQERLANTAEAPTHSVKSSPTEGCFWIGDGRIPVESNSHLFVRQYFVGQLDPLPLLPNVFDVVAKG